MIFKYSLFTSYPQTYPQTSIKRLFIAQATPILLTFYSFDLAITL
ncbi:protein of unknown function [Shewanella benthica]|uniref:Uncharacterized protein n=1 Tax=Shewanella benthica TaxID=43661 RepID=A0A330M174_9GAMM|nr:protein of unknown function [Shewanella benthica]